MSAIEGVATGHVEAAVAIFPVADGHLAHGAHGAVGQYGGGALGNGLNVYRLLFFGVPAFEGSYTATSAYQEHVVAESLGELFVVGVPAAGLYFKAFVEFAVRDYNKPMGVATYRASEEMPERLRKALPAIEDLKKLL